MNGTSHEAFYQMHAFIVYLLELAFDSNTVLCYTANCKLQFYSYAS